MGVKMRKCHVFFLSNTDESLHIRQISAMQMLSFRIRSCLQHLFFSSDPDTREKDSSSSEAFP